MNRNTVAVPIVFLTILVAGLMVPAAAFGQAGGQPGGAAPPPPPPPAGAQPLPPPTGAQPPPVAGQSEQSPVPDPTPTPTKPEDEVTTPSGLRYVDIKKGEGDKPRSGARVQVHYTGWLDDGTVFDSSVSKGQPLEFNTHTRVVEGWVEGVADMQVGGKRKLIIPPALGYGSTPPPRSKIPPDATLTFEIELLGISQQGPEQRPTEGLEPQKAESGLTTWEIKAGEGEVLAKLDQLKMNYSLWLENGRLLGSSLVAGRPFEGLLTQIPSDGLRQSLEGMKVGGVRRVLIPPDLATQQQRPPWMPADAAWVAEVELLEVTKPLSQTPFDGIEAVEAPSGLKYWDLKAGDGETPGPNAACKVHYTGWLADGTMFDSSLRKGEPWTLKMPRGAVPGFVEGVSTMKVGGKRRLEIPPQLAYGERPMGPIPANSTLIFEIELLSFENMPEQAPPAGMPGGAPGMAPGAAPGAPGQPAQPVRIPPPPAPGGQQPVGPQGGKPVDPRLGGKPVDPPQGGQTNPPGK